ncbi:putative Nucleolar essential protein [Tripterygium wilfordii]|uniref:Putative Nucleolar essential protein n=1 Tax=Tripterygium wilfordii TaxID=458696 RepID=A0A7J7CUS9_TRIWF|nr:putative Nucleolar essential protein [Tripterygium wilfordii]
MVRSYGVKVHKRKKREENYDKEEDEVEEQSIQAAKKKALTSTKQDEDVEKKAREDESKEEEEEAPLEVLEGIPAGPSDQKALKRGVIFVLERASLEVGKVGKSYQLLNSDEHANFLRRNNKNPADYRPDIIHQALLSILDSPLNKAGMVRSIYVKTEKGVLFEVRPHVRIPRTFKRFAGLMLQLLQKLSITAANKREKLLRVIKNPVTQYLPVNSRKTGLSYSSEKLVDIQKYVATIGDDMDLVFVVGAMAHGKIDNDYTDDWVASAFFLPLFFSLINDGCVGLFCF